jgi:hypothetical protein
LTVDAVGTLGDEAWGRVGARTLAPPLVGEPPRDHARQPFAGPSERVRVSAGGGRRGFELLDGENRLLFRGREVRLTPLQFRVFRKLARNAGSFVSTEALSLDLWGVRRDRDVKKYVLQIRKRLARLVEDGAATREEIDDLIESRWGTGYVLHPLDGKPRFRSGPGPK